MQKLITCVAILICGYFSTSEIAASPLEINLVGQGAEPAITADETGTLHVVFTHTEKDSPSNDVYYTQSNDGEKTWTRPVDLSAGLGAASHPVIALEGNSAIDLVWN